MLMHDDKKKMATLMVAKLGAPVPKSAPEGAESDSSDELDMISEEILSAIERKDVKGLKEALQSMISCCMDKEDSAEENSDT